jgi:ABC-2 type transport system permease protein
MIMRYYADLFLTYGKFRFRSWAEYRSDFTIWFVASTLLDGSTLLFLSVVFTNINQLEGWTFHEMVFIWGLSVITRFLANSLRRSARIDRHIRFGDPDRLLVRPPGLLFQNAGESGITLAALGRVLIGVVAILTVLPNLSLPWWSILYLPLAVLGGVLIMFSMQLIAACLCFWFTDAVSVLTTMSWMAQFGQYPASIFSPPLQFLFTWVMPYAMMSFYPAAFMLCGGEYARFGLFAPLAGVFFYWLSMAIWRTALGRYQSAGS